MDSTRLQRILDASVDGKSIFGTSFCISLNNESWCGASGNLTTDHPYFIASTTKLFVTALILKKANAGEINLDEPASSYLPAGTMNHLHVFKGTDYSQRITVKQLLAHTSGLPDYFQDAQTKNTRLETVLKQGTDRWWSFDGALDLARLMPAKFVPGTPGKAYYSDTNFKLLGRLLEEGSGAPFAELVRTQIAEPLEMASTYVYSDAEDNRPMPLYYKSSELHIPKAMTSFGPDGGAVSTSYDMMRFTKAFFGGFFFPIDYFAWMERWNSIFFPMRSGVGLHLFKLPWIMNPFGTLPPLIGHSGLSGALAFASPAKALYITGTVNQVARPDLSFRTAIKLIQNAR